MRVFVTGGAGYIGSHTCVELMNRGHDVLIYDNFSNSGQGTIKRIQLLANKHVNYIEDDIRNEVKLAYAMEEFSPDFIMNFAGLKSVPESIRNPEEYYDVNIKGLLSILKAMSSADCNHIIFSSSATVYGLSQDLPYTEDHALEPNNPYGMTKMISELILKDWCFANNNRRAVCLRYFNPAGAHPSGLIGEAPIGIPGNLIPYICQVAVGDRTELHIYGDDYSTRDGTAERDYIHVLDVASAHAQVVEKIFDLSKYQVLNIGTGRSSTVMEVVRAFESVSGIEIPIKFSGRREGDVPQSWADPARAEKLLNLGLQRGLVEICGDAWRWHRNIT